MIDLLDDNDIANRLPNNVGGTVNQEYYALRAYCGNCRDPRTMVAALVPFGTDAGQYLAKNQHTCSICGISKQEQLPSSLRDY